jgi:hypothetical protein
MSFVLAYTGDPFSVQPARLFPDVLVTRFVKGSHNDDESGPTTIRTASLGDFETADFLALGKRHRSVKKMKLRIYLTM